jgi:hypothetical protein
MIAEGRGLAFAAFRFRTRDAFDRVMGHRVAVAKIFKQRGQRGKPVPDRCIAPPLAPPCYSRFQLIAPSDDVCACDCAKLFGPLDAGEAHKVLHGGFVGPARMGVREIGEPLDLGRHVGQPVKLIRREHPGNTGGGNRELVGHRFTHRPNVVRLRAPVAFGCRVEAGQPLYRRPDLDLPQSRPARRLERCLKIQGWHPMFPALCAVSVPLRLASPLRRRSSRGAWPGM